MRLSPKSAAARLRALKSWRRQPFRILSAATKRRKRLRLLPFRKIPKIYACIGGLEVRLAHSMSDVKKAQRLRYDVFYREMSAVPDAATFYKKRDEDIYDPICDHLLVIDRAPDRLKKRPWPRRSRVVGTYRMLLQEAAQRHQGFYTQSEYDIAPLIVRKQETHKFMEVGRSCVLKAYRNKRTVELLWQGLWTYIRERKVDVMMGCASFAGTDPKAHALALSFLHHFASAPEEWAVSAHKNQYVDMNMMPKEAVNPKEALRAMPPLIKGYLRLGAFFGNGAVIDRQFGTTDVFVILPVQSIDTRYFAHFGAPDENLSQPSTRRARQTR